PEGLDHADAFIADQVRKLRFHRVAPGAIHRFSAVEAYCFDPDANLAGAGVAKVEILDLQHLRTGAGVDADCFDHLLFSCLRCDFRALRLLSSTALDHSDKKGRSRGSARG